MEIFPSRDSTSCTFAPAKLKRRGRGRFSFSGYTVAMTQSALELLHKALALPEDERTALVRSLIESLDGASDEGAEHAWDEEIAGRAADLDSGKAKTVSWEEIRQRISARLATEDNH
jgi:putative addiction module component (TIGR02574 family)